MFYKLVLVFVINNMLFKHYIKIYIEKVRDQALINLRKDFTNKSLKTKILNLFYDNSYIKCYYFHYQYKNYFQIIRVIIQEHILFAIFFVKK